MQKHILMILVPILALSCRQGDEHKIFFTEDFENDMGKWQFIQEHRIQTIDSGDSKHGKVLALHAGAPVQALIKNSTGWTNYKIEGDVLFPEDAHNYLGFVYNWNRTGTRLDYGCIYIKGNGSYVRVNPHRDEQVSRVLYEEFRAPLTGESAILTGQWQHFKAEVVGATSHFYVGDMETPKVTFPFLEFSSGRVGFEPRITGSQVWIDNISVESLKAFGYQGEMRPVEIQYQPERLITDWQALGPFRNPVASVESQPYTPDKTFAEGKGTYRWQSFDADGRGCVVAGKLLEFRSNRHYGYFHKEVRAEKAQIASLNVSTTDELKVWLNNRFVGTVEPTRFAWYDFLENPEHAGSRLNLELAAGLNHLIIRAKSVGWSYSGDGFYAQLSLE